MGEPAIAVTGLRKSFGPKEAVAGIDLEIAAGSLAGLVGPNGPWWPLAVSRRAPPQATEGPEDGS